MGVQPREYSRAHKQLLKNFKAFKNSTSASKFQNLVSKLASELSAKKKASN